MLAAGFVLSRSDAMPVCLLGWHVCSALLLQCSASQVSGKSQAASWGLGRMLEGNQVSCRVEHALLTHCRVLSTGYSSLAGRACSGLAGNAAPRSGPLISYYVKYGKLVTVSRLLCTSPIASHIACTLLKDWSLVAHGLRCMDCTSESESGRSAPPSSPTIGRHKSLPEPQSVYAL